MMYPDGTFIIKGRVTDAIRFKIFGVSWSNRRSCLHISRDQKCVCKYYMCQN